MSVFQTASVKIRDLLGITADGQATMAASLPVAIASDQSAVKVADGGGSLTVDGTVAVSAVSGSVAVTDGGGSLTVDGTVAVSNDLLTDTQLRATPVPISGALTDAELRATPVPVTIGERAYTYAAFRYWTLIGDAITSENGDGVDTPIAYYYTSNPASLGSTGSMTRLKNLADIQAAFRGALMGDQPRYFWIPFGSQGFTRFSMAAYGNLDVNLSIDVIGVSHVGALWGSGASPLDISTNKVYSELLAENIEVTSGGGGVGRFNCAADGAFPYLILVVTPASNPSSGSWMLSFSMQQ